MFTVIFATADEDRTATLPYDFVGSDEFIDHNDADTIYPIVAIYFQNNAIW